MADRSSTKYVVYCCLFIGYSAFYYNRKSYTSLIPALLRSLRLQESELGFISSSFAVSYGLSKFVIGILSDKIQPRGLFVVGLIGTGFCNAFFTTCRSVQMLALVWFLNGFFQGLSWPPCSKILKEWFRSDEFQPDSPIHSLMDLFDNYVTSHENEATGPSKIGKFWSFLTVGCNMTASICPLMTIYLTSKYNWQTAMLFPSSIALIIAPLFYVTISDSPNGTDEPAANVNLANGTKPLKASWTKVIFHLFASPFLWVLINGYFLASLMRNALTDWTQLYLIQEKKHSLSTAGLAMSSCEIGGMVGSIMSGVITDRWILKHGPSKNSSARMPVFVWLFAIFVICIHLLRTAVDAASSTFFIGLLLFGCGMAVSGSVSIYGLVAMENGPRGFSGTSHAIVALGASVGAVIAGYPLATLGKAYGWHNVFLLLQILGGFNFFVHLFTRGLNRQMIDPLKLE